MAKSLIVSRLSAFDLLCYRSESGHRVIVIGERRSADGDIEATLKNVLARRSHGHGFARCEFRDEAR